ncbi:MAG: ATP synthase F1 subunit gamma [Bdellovibrionota bacterium]
MASIKDLKKRIGTVKNTQQTTRAMKMVSAAKLRRAQEAIQNQRPYARRIGELIKKVSELAETEIHSPLLRREREEGSGRGRVLLVLLSSDRGLCGAFNGNVIKATQRWVLANGSSCQSVELAFVGRKAFDFFKTKKFTIGHNYAELGGKVTFAKAKTLSDSLIEMYLSGKYDEIKFIYNEFKNAATQMLRVEDYLPLENAQPSTEVAPTPSELGAYLIKPSAPEVLEQLLAKNFAIQAFRMMLESQASEHGARMSAMENATKNAGEMIKKLSLQYNKQRQAGITKELLEIISGSESQKG